MFRNAKQKVWAKWMAVAVYGLYIFRLIEGLINSTWGHLSGGKSIKMDSNTEVVREFLEPLYIIVCLFASGVGVYARFRGKEVS